MLFKSFAFEIKSAKDDGTIEGYASTFGNVDYGMDVVDKGAFKKTLKETKGKWPILADHDPKSLIGFNLKGEEDDHGLFTEFKLNLEVQQAREKYALAKQAQELGVPMGLSIGYMTIKAEPDRDKPLVRHLKELKLFEHSIVTFPMNAEAMITQAKGLAVVDRIQFFISQLKAQGISEEELSMALQGKGAAAPSLDPVKIGQSIDDLISKLSAP